ncbi:hypothetical protein C8Q75DRAFT_495000 [Abortiporus biennis]|nr:hypothetical protein C8Q75DRAFT_495000 [Abortiporus biennis]
MLHCFVTAKLLPSLPPWASYGRRAAERLVTTPFLALHIHNPAEPFVYGRPPNLFVITRQRPTSPNTQFFALNHTETGIRSLTVEPPLPFNGPLYLLITPRLAGSFPEADEDPFKFFSKCRNHQFEASSLSLFAGALESAQMSIPSERITGGDDEPGSRWDTWSTPTPREMPGVLIFQHQVPLDFQLLTLDVLPPEYDTNVFNEIPVVRQLVLDYTWRSCNSLLSFMEKLRKALPDLLSSDRLFRTPSLTALQPLAMNALQPATSFLQSLPIIHDGDPNPITRPQDDIADDWRDDIEVPDLELAVAEPVPAVPLGDIKVVLLDPGCLLILR